MAHLTPNKKVNLFGVKNFVLGLRERQERTINGKVSVKCCLKTLLFQAYLNVSM